MPSAANLASRREKSAGRTTFSRSFVPKGLIARPITRAGPYFVFEVDLGARRGRCLPLGAGSFLGSRPTHRRVNGTGGV
jgi:hypothetical protein